MGSPRTNRGRRPVTSALRPEQQRRDHESVGRARCWSSSTVRWSHANSQVNDVALDKWSRVGRVRRWDAAAASAPRAARHSRTTTGTPAWRSRSAGTNPSQYRPPTQPSPQLRSDHQHARGPGLRHAHKRSTRRNLASIVASTRRRWSCSFSLITRSEVDCALRDLDRPRVWFAAARRPLAQASARAGAHESLVGRQPTFEAERVLSPLPCPRHGS